MYVTAYNTSNEPLVVDVEGRGIGAHEWGTVDTTDEVAKPLLASGALVKSEAPKGDDVSPAFLAAEERTQAVAKTAKTLAAAEPARLEALAQAYAPGLAGQTKPALVAALAARGVAANAPLPDNDTPESAPQSGGNTTTSEGAE